MGKRQLDTIVLAKCQPEQFQLELDTYKFRHEHKVPNMYFDEVLPNDFGYTTNTKVKDVICTCKATQAGLRRILPVANTSVPVTCYPNCPRVLFTATMRQLRGPDDPHFKFNQQKINSYHKYCDKYFDEFIEPLLWNFKYDVNAWMNHLKTFNKQREIMPFYNAYKQGIKYKSEWETGAYLNYTVFAKQEKQAVGEKYPKCRAISACPPLMKWLKGPIAVALEKLFHGKLPGFKISSNGKPCKIWGDIEKHYEDCYKRGLDSIIDIDGSAWDSTQAYHMKYLPNKIYNWLADHNKIHHIQTKFFKEQINKRVRKLVAKAFIDDKMRVIFAINIDSTTFSGDPGTTLDNTITNASLNHWIMDEYGIEMHEYDMDAAGDDYSCKLPQDINTPHLHDHIRKHWKELGLIPKYILKGDYSNITFCSTNVIPYNDEGTTKFKIVRQLDRINPLSHYSRKALSYSQGRLRYHYQELATGMKNWTEGMPFYDDYRKVFQEYADSMKVPFVMDKPGKSKLTFPTDEEYDDSATYHNLDSIRISSNTPPPDVVYRFLLEKFGISRNHVRNMIDKLHYIAPYCELEARILPEAQNIPYQD